MPRQLGPSTTIPLSVAMRATSRCAAMPSSPPSAKPAEKITAAPTPCAASARTVGSTAAPGIASTAASTPAGSSSLAPTLCRPRIAARRGLTRWTSPAKPWCSRLASTWLPSAPGFSDAPTIATERGRSRRSSEARRGRASVSAVMARTSGLLLLLRQVVGAEARLERLVVDELLDTFLAAFIVVAVGGFLRADQIILGIVVAHHRAAAHGVLGRFERHGNLLEQDVGDLGHARLQRVERQRLVAQAPFGGGLAVDILAHHRMVHRLAEREQFDRDLGCAAAGQDAPVDLAESELGLLRGERQVAGEQRPV